MIPAGFIQDLLSRTDIVDVVGRHVELKRGGANLMGLCPFHAEKSPSFSVSPSKQFYHCFGCGASGDAIRFLTEHQGLSFVEAVRELAGAAGMQVPEEQVSADEQVRREKLRERRVTIGGLLARAGEFYRAQLKSSPRAVAYLKGRGLSGAVAARFGLGYAPPGWHALAGVFPAYDEPLLEEAGLVRRREAEGGDETAASRYDWFRDSIMFPIRSVQGEVIGFGGRVLDDSKPKYINSPETPVFSKGRELYGLFEARTALREKGFALVVEGYMDVVALAQSGFANAVATLGTSCTADHVQKLLRFTDAIVFSFDGDAAGRRAADRALEAALPHATDLRSIRFLFLPPEHDPDSYVRELGAPAFEKALKQAVPLSRQLVEMASADADLETAEGRARLLAQARPLWSALPEGALRRQVLSDLAPLARLGAEEIAATWNPAPVRPRAVPMAQAPRRPRATRRAPADSADLALRLLLRQSAWWDQLQAEDRQLLLELGGEHGSLVAWLEQQVIQHGPMTWTALAEGLKEHPLQATANRLVDPTSIEEAHRFDDLQRVVGRLWVARLEDDASSLVAEASQHPERLQQLREVRERIRLIKAEMTGAATD